MAPVTSPFFDRWVRWFPNTPPLGYRLRQAYPQLWFRIHSLPESKRYAASEAEYRELLIRHNTIASDVLGVGSPCAMLITTTCDPRWTSGLSERAGLEPDAVSLLWKTPPDEVDPDNREFEPEGWCVFGAQVQWAPGRFDPLIRSVAEDQIQALFVSLESGRVYAPYDGGADLFLRSSSERDHMRTRHKQWLSSHPEGL